MAGALAALAAAGPALGVTVEDLGRRWEEWRKKLP
jgi:hypothetical protein